MAVAIRMPDLGPAANAVRLSCWLVEQGARIARGDILAEVETDKTTTELISVTEGVLLQRLAAEGDSFPPGAIIAYVGEYGETLPSTPAAPAAEPGQSSSPAGQESRAPRIPLVVRNLAGQLGVDLSTLTPTGARGAITREDVLRAARRLPDCAVQLSERQRHLARIFSAAREIPPLRMAIRMDATEFQRRRAWAGHDALLLKAIARLLPEFPLFLARWEDGELVPSDGIHITLAVHCGYELHLPVIRDAGVRSLDEIQKEIDAVTARAGFGELTPEECRGGCIAVINLDTEPLEWFEPLVLPGHSATLAAGAMQDRVIAAGGRVEIRPSLTVTLAADHRFIHPRLGAQFLARLKQTLEAPGFE